MFLNTFNDTVFMEEVHLMFSGVDIHIYVMWGNLQATAITKESKINQQPYLSFIYE